MSASGTMWRRRSTIASFALAALMAASLSGCGSFDRFASFEAWSGKKSDPAPSAVAAPADIAGRWMLAAPGQGQCALIFSGANPGTAEGSIAPEGGCPGKFYTSRKWTYEATGLVIRDHNGEPLATLTFAGKNYDGQSRSGEPITLAR